MAHHWRFGDFLTTGDWRLEIVFALEIGDCLTTGDWRLSHHWRFGNVTLGELDELGELPHWRFVNITLGELGELGELPHWRLANITPRCFVARGTVAVALD